MKLVALMLSACGIWVMSCNEARACRFGYRGGLGGGFYNISPLQGMAMLYQAMGQYNLNNSIAARNDQEAYSRYLDNRRKKAENHFAMRRMNESHRAQHRKPSLTPKQLYSINQSRLPRRLSSEQWQPLSGAFFWPSQLLGEEFAAERVRLERWFAERTPEDSGVGSSGYGEVQQLTRRMQAKLALQVKKLRPEEYILSRRFIDSVGYEARFPPLSSQLAAN
jgi:hypothetical protein